MNPTSWIMPEATAFATGCSIVSTQSFEDDTLASITDTVIEEVPISLEWNSTHHLVMMATPTDLEEFAVGFSLSEGIIESASQILSLDIVPTASGVGMMMQIPETRLAQVISRDRARIGNSSCGLCGMRDIQAALQIPNILKTTHTFHPQAIINAMQRLPQFQPIGKQTGAAHAAGFASFSGEILLACEDAGRHNALDKLIGKMAMQNVLPVDGFLVLTSRASFEMVQKAAVAGFCLLSAISAPTGLAVRMAEQAGITLIAFAREARFSCFSHSQRIKE